MRAHRVPLRRLRSSTAGRALSAGRRVLVQGVVKWSLGRYARLPRGPPMLVMDDGFSQPRNSSMARVEVIAVVSECLGAKSSRRFSFLNRTFS